LIADPPASHASSDQTGLLVLVAPLTISTKAYVPLVEAVQVGFCLAAHDHMITSSHLFPVLLAMLVDCQVPERDVSSLSDH